MAELEEIFCCAACGNAKGNSAFVAKERMFGMEGSFQYCECNACKSLSIIDAPPDLGAYYPADYYSFVEYQKSEGIAKFLKKIRFKAFQNGVSIKDPVYFNWLSNLGASESMRIADIGCGNGQLLAELSYCGFRILHGYDPFLDSSIEYPGFSLRKKDYFDLTERYDILMFHHAFEHILDPVSVFEKFDQFLNPGGRVLIRVPVTDGQVWKDEREFWFQLDAPRHLFIPSTRVIEVLADRFGMELYKTEFDSLDNQFWGTELYKRGKPFFRTDISKEFTSKELAAYQEKADLYNQQQRGDQACFYLRKRS